MSDEIEKLERIWATLNDKYEKLPVDERVSRIMRGPSVSHRFALITQLVGALLDPTKNTMALQSGAEVEGAWDPRSFAAKIIVPWLRNHRSPLGSSPDPYVSNPLRRPVISPKPDGVKPSTLPFWQDIYDLLQEAQWNPGKIEELTHQAVSIIRRLLDEQDRPLVLPPLVSPQIVINAVEQFLKTSSGGDRAMAVVTAIFSVLIAPFLAIHNVQRAAVNASDTSSGVAGDIICTDANGVSKIIVEVKERSLNFEDVRSSLGKTIDTQSQRYVFASPLLEPIDIERIKEISQAQFDSQGRACHFVSILDLLAASLLLNSNEAGSIYLKEVEKSLTQFNTQPANRTAWRDLIADLLH